MKATRYGAIAAGVTAAGALGAAGYLRATRPDLINDSVPEPARPVEIDRYLGRWFELARHENRFERGLEEVTADYGLLAGGKIEVFNAGRKPGAAQRSGSRGKAVVVDAATGAKLKVSFFGPFFLGNYWVLDHAPDYRWSIVGEPTGRYVWILCRSAHPQPEELERLLARVAALGYDRNRLRLTRHG